MLTFTPAANAYGSSVCNVTLVDGGGLRSASAQLTVTVTPVNDPPSFTLGSAPFLAANPGTFSFPGFAKNISQGLNEDSAPPELQFPLQFNVISCNNLAMFEAGGSPTITAAGTLDFKLTQNTGGLERTSVCQVLLQEVGGLATSSRPFNIIQSRCSAGAAYVKRFDACQFYRALTIPSNPGVEYNMFTDALTWPEAATVCQSMGRRLVKLTDATQDAQLYAAVTAITGNQYWIGLNDQNQEGAYRWSDGSSLVTANWPNGGPWLPGEPNNSLATNVLGEDCVMMNGGKWRDWDCNKDWPYICG
ncbi:hypothetical protein OEZ86_008536 [Tetradesmus obliquus]|nr:hypothetical protein OEZ86_008536 [Tetradesmus obliquus]